MCWSAEASWALAAGGTAAALISYRRGDPPAFWLTLGFFSVMEGLQGASYPVLGNCSSAVNKNLTLASFLHLCLHPLFFNALALQFVPEARRRKISPLVFSVAALLGLATAAQILPSAVYGACAEHRAMCGCAFCTMPGHWHLAWQFPLNGWGNGFATHPFWPLRLFADAWVPYTLGFAVLPLLYGAWRITLFQVLMGPGLVMVLTPNPDERAAIWCLLSVAIAVVIIYTPVQRLLRQPRTTRPATP